jgi:hypothetical protein
MCLASQSSALGCKTGAVSALSRSKHATQRTSCLCTRIQYSAYSICRRCYTVVQALQQTATAAVQQQVTCKPFDEGAD